MCSYWNSIVLDVPIVELAEILKHKNIRFDQTKISKVTYVEELLGISLSTRYP